MTSPDPDTTLAIAPPAVAPQVVDVSGSAAATASLPRRRDAALAAARLLRFLALLPAPVFLPVVLSPPLNHDVAAVLQLRRADGWPASGSMLT